MGERVVQQVGIFSHQVGEDFLLIHAFQVRTLCRCRNVELRKFCTELRGHGVSMVWCGFLNAIIPWREEGKSNPQYNDKWSAHAHEVFKLIVAGAHDQ